MGWWISRGIAYSFIPVDECTFIFYYRYSISRSFCQPEILGWRTEVSLEELCITELPRHKWKNLFLWFYKLTKGGAYFVYTEGQRGYLNIWDGICVSIGLGLISLYMGRCVNTLSVHLISWSERSPVLYIYNTLIHTVLHSLYISSYTYWYRAICSCIARYTYGYIGNTFVILAW